MYIPGHNFAETLNGTGDADSIVALAGDDVIFEAMATTTFPRRA